MGFWEEKNGNKTVLIGDEPLDVLMDALDSVSSNYEEALGRKPTVHELEQLIKSAVEGLEELYLSDTNEFVIADVKIKLKKTKKKNYKPGDIFAIPLNKGELYAYGKVVVGSSTIKEDVYIEYYDLFSNQILSIKEFKQKQKEISFTLMSGISSILSGEWIKIGSVPFNRGEYKLPDFYGEIDGKYFISKGISCDPEARVWGVSEKEALKAKNPDGLIGSHIIQEWLYQKYRESNG